MRLLLNFTFACLLFASCSHGFKDDVESRKSSRNIDNACSALRERCHCRLRRKHEQTLTCSRENRLEQLPTNKVPLTHATDIKCIVITRQENITSIGSSELHRLSNLSDIRIFRCKVRDIAPDAFEGLQYVERLDLHRNDLTEVPLSIKYLPNLKSLNLGGNRITFVNADAFESNILLKKLVFSRNALTRMPVYLPKSLIKLSLSGNMLQSVEYLQNFDRLEILNVDGNELTEFPEELPKSIKVLNLCGNKIDQTISLHNLPNLTMISLNDNPNIGHITLSTFADTLSRSSTSKLKTFNARNAGIRSIEVDSFACLPKLQHLDVSNNAIQSYHSHWFVGNRLLRSLHLTGNRWQCDCNVKSNLEVIANKFNMRRKNKNDSFAHDFAYETCRDGSSCGEFKLKQSDICPRVGMLKTTTPVVEKMPWERIPARLLSIKETTTLLVTPIPTTVGSTTKLSPSTTDTTTTKLSPTTIDTTTTTAKLSPSTTDTTTTKLSPTTTDTTTAKLSPSTTDTTTTTVKIPTTEKTQMITTTTETEEEQWCLEDGRKCHFPFVYDGEEHHECIDAYYHWCSPTYNYVNGDWGECVRCLQLQK